jgi:hypothetical protein
MIVRHKVCFEPSLKRETRKNNNPTNSFIFFPKRFVLVFFNLSECGCRRQGREMIALIALIICQSGLLLVTYNFSRSRTQLRWGITISQCRRMCAPHRVILFRKVCGFDTSFVIRASAPRTACCCQLGHGGGATKGLECI